MAFIGYIEKSHYCMVKTHTDVCRRQILHSEVDTRIVRVEIFLMTSDQ